MSASDPVEKKDLSSLSVRQGMIVGLCDKPVTIIALANELGTSEITVRRDIYDLLELGYIVEFPFRDGKRKQYVNFYSEAAVVNKITNGKAVVPAELKFRFREEQYTVNEVAIAFTRTDNAEAMAKRLAGIFAHLVSRSRNIEHHGSGGATPPSPEETFTHLMDVREYFMSIVKLVDQLAETKPFWQDKAAEFVDMEEGVADIASLYEHVENGSITKEQWLESARALFG